ncbi:DUF6036 family nucleotidyltransferase [Pseudarthrobacter sp. BIM B-2242]|uniref:DUF6036 family nucleotidyltransferase n=1 Tax=Pseudarthrobacter sp. BIM B-2242 TaxID=2772401 RepID=UPI00168B36CB|nr:DUF6036 family nucleotidyltransferase [Pseudarthrobacter sp. BIM B-2242]QOD05904.1 hypothetical protein IDT60_20250 [Pseudarthrobacter sp. BIM B-2242]
MRRDELELAIRQATRIIQHDQVVIIGSQSILGSYTEDQLPTAVTMSTEVDIAPMRDEGAQELTDRISFVAGELSDFHRENGFYIEGVEKQTAILPPDWKYRLVMVRGEETDNATGLCLDPHDLCAAKLMAWRPKDFEFVRALIDGRFIDPVVLAERVASIDIHAVVTDQPLEALEYRQRESATWLANFANPRDSRRPAGPTGSDPDISP